MSANTDASTQLAVRFKTPRKGSCLTPELLKELAELLEVTFKSDIDPNDVAMKVSDDANNLATLDSSGRILVPAVKRFTDEKTWEAGVTTELVFDGWAGDGIDAIQALRSVELLLDDAEAGEPVMGDPSGTKNIWPSLEYSFTAGEITVYVHNATEDCVVRVTLIQFPTASESE